MLLKHHATDHNCLKKEFKDLFSLSLEKNEHQHVRNRHENQSFHTDMKTVDDKKILTDGTQLKYEKLIS